MEAESILNNHLANQFVLQIMRLKLTQLINGGHGLKSSNTQASILVFFLLSQCWSLNAPKSLQQAIIGPYGSYQLKPTKPNNKLITSTAML